jgi:hypothetical protein
MAEPLKYTVVIERSETGYGAYVPDLPRFPAGPAGRKAGCGQDCPPHKTGRTSDAVP